MGSATGSTLSARPLLDVSAVCAGQTRGRPTSLSRDRIRVSRPLLTWYPGLGSSGGIQAYFLRGAEEAAGSLQSPEQLAVGLTKTGKSRCILRCCPRDCHCCSSPAAEILIAELCHRGPAVLASLRQNPKCGRWLALACLTCVDHASNDNNNVRHLAPAMHLVRSSPHPDRKYRPASGVASMYKGLCPPSSAAPFLLITNQQKTQTTPTSATPSNFLVSFVLSLFPSLHLETHQNHIHQKCIPHSASPPSSSPPPAPSPSPRPPPTPPAWPPPPPTRRSASSCRTRPSSSAPRPSSRTSTSASTSGPSAPAGPSRRSRSMSAPTRSRTSAARCWIRRASPSSRPVARTSYVPPSSSRRPWHC